MNATAPFVVAIITCSIKVKDLKDAIAHQTQERKISKAESRKII